MKVNLAFFLDRNPMPSKKAEAIAQAILADLTAQTLRNITSKAGALRSTRKTYLDGLAVYSGGKYKNIIEQTSWLGNAVEKGISAFDMKKGLLASSKVKFSKEGLRYITVPFRIGTPDASGETSNPMPDKVYAAAKALRASITGNKGTMYGERMTNVPKPFDISRVRAAITDTNNDLSEAQRAEYVSKVPVFQGMIRQEKTYERATSSVYNTFRRVSERSQQNAFIHPGIQKRGIMEAALKQMESEAGAIVKNVLDAAMSK